jgi:hypothetical protein
VSVHVCIKRFSFKYSLYSLRYKRKQRKKEIERNKNPSFRRRYLRSILFQVFDSHQWAVLLIVIGIKLEMVVIYFLFSYTYN